MELYNTDYWILLFCQNLIPAHACFELVFDICQWNALPQNKSCVLFYCFWVFHIKQKRTEWFHLTASFPILDRVVASPVAERRGFTLGLPLIKLLNHFGGKMSSQTYFYFPFVLMRRKAKDEGLNPMACGFVLQPIHLTHNH